VSSAPCLELGGPYAWRCPIVCLPSLCFHSGADTPLKGHQIFGARQRETTRGWGQLKLIRPGRPTYNTKVETLNGRFRHAYLNAHRPLSLDDAKAKIEERRWFYNEARPFHIAVDYTI